MVGLRSRTSNLSSSAGIRRRNTLGGELQRPTALGFQTSNSTFFTPGNQGSTRMSLSYTQPVLRGAGRTYNRSQIVIAQIGTDAANQRYLERLQTHLLDVTDAYWDLYRKRALLLQRRKLYSSAQTIVEQMKKRASIDSTSDQLIRAEAAATKRLTDLIRSETDVVDAQDRLRSLVNSPRLEADWRMEFVPLDGPTHELVPLNLQESLAIALDYRPDVVAALQDIKSASVERFVAESDLLPQLNLVLETYVSGLRGSFDVGSSFQDQFRQGEPSYTVGLNYEMPLGNRAALARDRRAQLEVARLQAQFRTVVERVTYEVRIAVRNIDTLGREMEARYEALEKAKDEVIYIENRMRLLHSMNKTASLYLENLLTSQERLATAEAEYLESKVAYTLALLKLKQVTGTLLTTEELGHDTEDDWLYEDLEPEMELPSIRVRPLPEEYAPEEESPGVLVPSLERPENWIIPGDDRTLPLPRIPAESEGAAPGAPDSSLLEPSLERPLPQLVPLPGLGPLEETDFGEGPPPSLGPGAPTLLEPRLEEPEPIPLDAIPRPDRNAPNGDLDARYWRTPFQRVGSTPRRSVWD
ncbi:MAG: TolC family protein [Pirellulaceae bacterium]